MAAHFGKEQVFRDLDAIAPGAEFALLYFTQGQYEEAEPLYQRSLKIWEKSLDPDHPNVAMPLKTMLSCSVRQDVLKRPHD